MSVSGKSLATRGAVLELSGFAASQAVRLVSTLLLSRLLFPEAFGLAALVAIFMQGLTMLSDTGVEQCVVQNPSGDDPRFLNTAWSIDVVRGIGLWLVACVSAWPLSVLYKEPQLLQLIPVGSFALVIGGFTSTSLYSFRRAVRLGPLIGIELLSQAITLVAIVGWAYFDPTVWALIFSGLVLATVKAVASHVIDAGYRNRFEWDPAAGREIFHFGKWIFGSSALSFVARQSDRLLIGHFSGVATLGIYSMAFFLSEAAGLAVARVTSGVLYPVLSKIARDEPHRLRDAFYHARLRTDFLGLVPLGGLMIMSQTVVDVLYDERYAAAGWMLQALCLRVALGVIVESMQNCLFSLGHTQYGFYQNIVRSTWILAGIPIGWHFWGLSGLVWATALSEIPVLFLVWAAFRKFELLRASRESLSFVIFLLGMLLGTAGNWLFWEFAAYFNIRF